MISSQLLTAIIQADRERQIDDAQMRRTGRRRKRPLTRIPAYRAVKP